MYIRFGLGLCDIVSETTTTSTTTGYYYLFRCFDSWLNFGGSRIANRDVLGMNNNKFPDVFFMCPRFSAPKKNRVMYKSSLIEKMSNLKGKREDFRALLTYETKIYNDINQI